MNTYSDHPPDGYYHNNQTSCTYPQYNIITQINSYKENQISKLYKLLSTYCIKEETIRRRKKNNFKWLKFFLPFYPRVYTKGKLQTLKKKKEEEKQHGDEKSSNSPIDPIGISKVFSSASALKDIKEIACALWSFSDV